MSENGQFGVDSVLLSQAMDTLDPDICWRACLASDRRFDGRFWVGVVTTGIYCRPICPAPRPRRRNVRFFPTAFAAAEQGFRPCLRCRPESAPGSAVWRGTSATVTRALRLIEAGALRDDGIEPLAAALGVGSRQLRRLFAEHLGASPLAVAHTQRLHFAKKLVDETRLPMTEIALAAGFASVRRFNDSFLRVYERSPRELRRESASGDRPAADGELRLALAFRGALDWDAMLAYLGPRATPGVERVDGRTYLRTIRAGAARGMLRATVEPQGRHVLLRLQVPGPAPLWEAVRRARRMFDLDGDPATIAQHLRRDATLGPRLRGVAGLRLPCAWDPFELAVRTVLGQQISVRAATTLAGRLAARWGEPLASAGDGRDSSPGLVFPEPRQLIDAELHTIGIPKERAETIRRVALAFADGALDRAATAGLDALVERLCAIPGIGEWTANYVALRAYGEPDAFPAADLGLRKAVAPDGKPVSAKRLTEIAEAWRPWRGLAAIHLWSTLEVSR
jgi:AraC family transcriptional regulator of adaptative response / DNA-3-methyladenine glycosylase II